MHGRGERGHPRSTAPALGETQGRRWRWPWIAPSAVRRGPTGGVTNSRSERSATLSGQWFAAMRISRPGYSRSSRGNGITEVESRHIEVRGISVEVVRKNIKNLHLGVYPPHGRVRVAAPLRLDAAVVRLAVIQRLGWIRRKQTDFVKQQRQSQREFVSGESHYFFGKRYRLKVTEQDCPPKVKLLNNTRIGLTVRPGTNRDKREAVLYEWYREHLRAQVQPLIEKWEPKMQVSVDEVRIRKMKTQWGACNIEARRIWLNLELAKKPKSCLVYVLVHEMTHLLERHHNDRFRELMDTFLPQWRTYRDELNKAPLAYENWRY